MAQAFGTYSDIKILGNHSNGFRSHFDSLYRSIYCTLHAPWQDLGKNLSLTTHAKTY